MHSAHTGNNRSKNATKELECQEDTDRELEEKRNALWDTVQVMEDKMEAMPETV